MRKIYSLAFLAIFSCLTTVDALAQCGTTPITGDFIISANTSLSGIYNVSGIFRVDAGVTVTVTPYATGGCGELIVNATDVQIIGDIIADGAGFLGGTGGTGGTTGNNVGALTGCVNKDNCIVIDVNGGVAGGPGNGPGAGLAGNGGSLGMGPKQECQNNGDDYGFVPGAGGAGGAAGGSYGGVAAQGGAGGNGSAYNSGNFSGMGIAGCASPVAGNGGTGGVIGATYGTATGTDIALGSGGAGSGGGGKSASNGSVGGAGGAGGGRVELRANGNLTVAGNISVNGQVGAAGGNGGNGGTTTDCCSDGCNDCGERTFSSGAGGGAGAGGGSGGGIFLRATGVSNITGTLRSIGGNGGTGGSGGAGHSGCGYSALFCGSNSGNSNAGASGNLGGAASGGRIKIFQNPCQPNVISASILINGGNGFGGVAADGTYHLGDIASIVAPTLSSSTVSTSCFGLGDGAGTVSIVSGGTAPFTYSWDDPSTQTTPTATGLAAGTYEVTVTDANLCTVTETVVVPQPDTLTAQIFGTINADCFGFATGEASVMGLGGTMPYTYLWNDPSTQITATATGLPDGTWVAEITDVNGCVATDTATIGEPTPFAASVAVDANVSCNGDVDGQATVTANGIGLTYSWDDPLTQSTATASNLAAGSYNVTVSSSQTCDTTITVVITQPALLTVLAVQNQQVSCNGGNNGVALAGGVGGTAPFAYQWDDSALQTTPSATGLAAGTYNVVVTDANLCTVTAQVVVTQASAMSIAVSVDNASCNGVSDGQISAIVSGGTSGYTYQWNPGAIAGNPLTGVAAGSYSLTVTDANSCTAELQNILVQEPLPIVLTLAQEQDISCNGASDGLAEISQVGGTAPFTYLWDDPTAQSTALAGGLPPGTYSVEVTDANGCTGEWLNVNITEPDELIVTVSSTTPITCAYSDDGVAQTAVVGGTTPFNYSWSDGQTSGTAIGLGAGDFTVTVTDANGCTAQAVATIDPPANVLNADFTVSPETGQQPMNITITNLSEGGTAYEWIFGDGNTLTTFDTASFEFLYADSGTFTLTLIAYDDVTGCTDTMTLQNGIYVEPTSFIDVPNVFTPNGDGINDMFPIDPTGNNFFPFEIRNIYDFKGEIYNRWGQKVYQWTQPLAGWDGRTTSGLELNTGTYYFVITAKGVDGDSVKDYELKGDVTMIK